MLKITDTQIKLTKGDTAYLTVPLTHTVNGTKQAYTMQPTDTLTLTVSKSVNDDTTRQFQKVLTGTNQFKIEPSDTRSVPLGKYHYDIQLDTASGDVFTVIENSIFVLTDEVTI